jgi:hypothetical protein
MMPLMPVMYIEVHALDVYAVPMHALMLLPERVNTL